MVINNNVEKHLNICKELNKIYEKKNNDYGDSFHRSFQEYGSIVSCIRLEDKLNRLKSIAKGKKMQVTDESEIDTLLDLANYAIMSIMELQIEVLKKQ